MYDKFAEFLDKVMAQGGKYDKVNPGAKMEEIEAAEKRINFKFPKSYIQFLRQWNGCKGWWGSQPFVIGSAESTASETLDFWDTWVHHSFVKHLVFFGSDAGELQYVFDTRKPTNGDEYQIVIIDNDDWEVPRPVADSFAEFINEYFLKEFGI